LSGDHQAALGGFEGGWRERGDFCSQLTFGVIVDRRSTTMSCSGFIHRDAELDSIMWLQRQIIRKRQAYISKCCTEIPFSAGESGHHARLCCAQQPPAVSCGANARRL